MIWEAAIVSTRRGGKAKQRARKAARRPGRSGDELAVFDGMCREVLATEGRDVLRSGDPLEAELWASSLLGTFGRCPLVGEVDPVAAIGGRFVAVARRARTPVAHACLRALAVVAEGDLGRRASRAASELTMAGSLASGWVNALGTAEPTEAWRATDLCGDQDSVMVGFRYPNGAEHSIVVLVDHVLGGTAKDVAVLGPLSDVTASWRGISDIELVEEPVGVAAGRVIEAMERTSRTINAPVSDDYGSSAPLVRARLGPLVHALPETEPLAPEQREELVRAFLTDPAGTAYRDDSGAWFLLDAIVDYRCDYHGRDPLRWSGGAALLFLLDFVPRKITAEQQDLARVPDVLRAWVAWAAKRAGLPAHLAAETVQVIGEAEGQFAEAIADERRWGPAKLLAMDMLADGVDLTDIDAANAWLDARTA
jgi:hypothetical protein